MSATDEQLLRRITEGGDAEAFSLVVNRYADLVYSACARILRDEARASDAVQETFFELFKHAGCVRGCLGGWLHRVATRRAIDQIRSEEARRRRETAYALVREQSSGSWSEVESAVDEALDSLDDELRELLTLHFLRQQTMGQIAARKGISQPTVSRRVAHALECLRAALKDRGVAVGVVPLQTMLVHGTQLAPEALLFKLGKMALAQAAATQSSGAFGVLGIGTATKLFVVGGATAACVIGAFLFMQDAGPQTSAPLPLPARGSPPMIVQAAASSVPAKTEPTITAVGPTDPVSTAQTAGATAAGTSVAQVQTFRPASPASNSGPPQPEALTRTVSAAPIPPHLPPILPTGAYLPPQGWRPPRTRDAVPRSPRLPQRGYLTVIPYQAPPVRYVGGGGSSGGARAGGGASMQLQLRQQVDPKRPVSRTRVR